MFDKVANAYIDACDGIKGEYLGRALFTLTPEVEMILLDYVHNGKMEDPIVLRDVFFYPGRDDYTIPMPYEKYSRKGILRAMFRDKYSLQWVPVEILAKFNIRARARPDENPYHFASIEYSDIVVESMKVKQELV
ncbi:MAG: hypothetical protein VB071_05770 [Lawsonibacter sp.]|nr:hypothetical protein [Lawsonibacter sp.]